MAISFGSIGTGLPKDIVGQLVEAEKVPIKQMEARKGKIEEKKKLLSELINLTEAIRGDLAKNGTSLSLKELKVETNNDILGVAVDKTKAMPGNYQVEVMDLASRSSAVSNGFPDKDKTYIGVGYIAYELPTGEEKEIYVGPENATLQGIADLINKQSDIGMKANVVNDGTGEENPYRLVLNVQGTGDDNAVYFPNFYFVDGEEDLYLEQEKEGHNGKIKLNGFEMQIPDNKNAELVPGLTIDFKKARPGEEFSLSVKEDKEAVGNKISEFIQKINGVLGFINKQNKLDEKSDTTKTLGGDLTLQTLESRLRSALLTPVRTEFGVKRLNDVGVTFTRDGLLNLDQKKLDAAIAENYQSVSQLFTGYYPNEVDEETGEIQKNDGVMTTLNNSLQLILKNPDGVLQSRKKGLQSNIDQIDRQIASRMRLIEQKERNLKDKFSRLESTISKIKGQGGGLSGMSAMNPVQQLG